MPNIDPTPIRKGSDLEPIIIDRLRVRILKEGKPKGNRISSRHLNAMLRSEAFLQRFPPVDLILKTPVYLPGFVLTQPGYHDGGPGSRVLYVGHAPQIRDSLELTRRFLEVMDFASNADRTNAVGARLTVMLRNHWLGAKPTLVVTSSKSHGGKDTTILFATGSHRSVSISYQRTNWALERSFVGAVKANPETGVVVIENARLGKGEKIIASGFLERFITDPEPQLFSTGTGGPIRRKNDLVLAFSTNFGTVSEDLLNRALPIHLNPVGDVASRSSAIGNPKHEYLPAQAAAIDAEFRGMIARWVEAGNPPDLTVQHPFTEWARTVGGILKVNGFQDFLGNYTQRKTHDDPLRQALGLLGLERPDEWLRPAAWVQVSIDLGLLKAVIPEAERDSVKSRARGLGVVFSAHRDETFTAESEDQKMTLKLERQRRRFEPGEDPTTRYRFTVLKQEPIPEDPPPV